VRREGRGEGWGGQRGQRGRDKTGELQEDLSEEEQRRHERFSVSDMPVLSEVIDLYKKGSTSS
jgi:hypothetical protein